MIDITRYLDINTTSWPGDVSFEVEKSLSIAEGASINLSAIKTSVHNGTHADAPFHVDDLAATIDEAPLGAYVGPCTVVDVRGVGRVEAHHIEAARIRSGDRVLLKTAEDEADLNVWTAANPHINTNAVIALMHNECPLVGIDTPSVDPSASKTLDAHHALNRADIRILENLDLRAAEAGRYVLVALPLKLRGLDASPVRAVLYGLDEFSAIARRS